MLNLLKYCTFMTLFAFSVFVVSFSTVLRRRDISVHFMTYKSAVIAEIA